MNLQDILKTGILAENLLYRPAIVPVDYGGSVIFQLSLRLTDGSFLTRSSFEVDSALSPDSALEASLALLRESVEKSGMRPRCDYLDAGLTKAYRLAAGQPLPDCAVSACLCGECCRYDGGGNLVPAVAKLVEDGLAFPVCPELSGGLAAPRPPCELSQGEVKDASGALHTAAFAAGARRCLRAVQLLGIRRAVLKERSPSCGVNLVYDGSFSGTRIAGEGLFAALLRENGISAVNEEAVQ